MASPYIGEIKIVALNFAPKGYAYCNGQTLSINQNAALFSLLGTTYGGDGVTTFRLPDFQGKTPIGIGQGPGLPNFVQGQIAGSSSVTLVPAQLPQHTHILQASTSLGDSNTPEGKTVAAQTANPYASGSNTTMAPGALQTAGSNQPHSNMQPYLVLNFVIALQGIFPSRG
jgi:microcystin-dependent protein